MEALTVERAIWIAAPRERVWQAVTDPQLIGQWWPPDAWDISALEVGGKVTFGPPDDAAHATLTLVDPPRELRMTWEPNPMFPVATMATTLRLDEQDGGTRLTVTETGYETLPDDIRQKRYESSDKGYADVLESLKALLEH